MKRPARLTKRKALTVKRQEKVSLRSLVKFFLVVPVLLLLLVCGSWLTVEKAQAASGINKQINFQGKLVDNNGLNVADSTYTVVFSLYTLSSGGSAAWTESDSVTTKNGVFQVALGANTAFLGNVDFNSDTWYLGINVNSNGEMTPRIRFSAVPYAFNAAALDGVVATNSATQFTITGATNSPLTLTVNGSLTLGSTIQPTSNGALTVQSTGSNGLTLDTGGAAALSIGATANSITFGATNNPSYAFNGTGSFTVAGGGANNITFGSSTGNGTVVIQPNAGGQASLFVVNQGSGDLLTASAGATTKFIVHNDGSIQIPGANGTADITTITGGNGLTIMPKANGSGAGGGLTLKAGNGTSAVGGNITIDAGTGSTNGTITIGGTNSTGITIGRGSSEAVTLNLGSDATGDLYYRSSGGSLANLPVGTSSQCLVGGTTPTWGNCITGGGQDLAQSVSSLANTTLAATSTLIGTVSITPTTTTGDLWVQAQLWTNSLSNTNQTLTWELHVGSLCSGTLLTSQTSALTSASASDGPAGFLSYVTDNPGTSPQTFAICGKSGTASGASAGGVATATVIDNSGPQGPQGPAGATQWQEVANGGALTYISPSTITDALSIGVTGSGSNVVPWSGLYVEPANFNTKGNALVAINQTGLGDIFTASSSGIPVFTVGKVAGTAANGFTFTPSVTTAAVAQAATGTDTNIGLTLDAKGSGTVTINGTGTGGTTIGHGLTLTSGTTLTLTGDTVAGTPTWSSSQAITLSTASQPNITSVGTLTGLTVSGTSAHTSTSATAFTIASSGTNYGLQVDESAGSAVTGIKIAAAPTGGTTALTVLDTGANSSLSLDAKGTGSITIGGTSSGGVTLGGNNGLGNVLIQPNAGGQAALIIKDQSVGDIFTASAGATTRFRISNAGGVLFQGDVISSVGSTSNGNSATQTNDSAVANAIGDQGSLVPNAGFESAQTVTKTNVGSSDPVFADGWVAAATAAANVVRIATDSAKGNSSLFIKLPQNTSTAIYSTCIPATLAVSGVYTLNFYVKASTASTVVRGYLDQYSTKANCQSDTSRTVTSAQGSGATPTSWTSYGSGASTITTTGSTANWARIHIFVACLAGCNAAPTDSTVEIDGVRLIEAANTTGVDYAENYPADPAAIPQAGDVVALESLNDVAAVRSATTADGSAVIGVVSTNPGQLLNDPSVPDPKVPVALAGRIPTKVSTANGPIHIGDYLTASDIPGVAVKAITAGPVIGTAMQDDTNPDPTAVTQITMFVKNSYYSGIPSAIAGQDTTITFDGQHQLVIGATGSSSAALTVDAHGNLNVAGIITAKSFETSDGQNVSDSLSQLSDLMASLSARVDSLEAHQATNSAFATDPILNSLRINTLATVSGNFRVEGNGLFEGVVHVVGDLVTNNLIVNGFSEFFDNAVFHKDISVEGHINVLGDSAGSVIVHQGEKKATVTFTQPYIVSPVITASLTLDESSATDAAMTETNFFSQGYTYVITDQSAGGFSIVLNKPATTDMIFTWTALGQDGVSPTPGE